MNNYGWVGMLVGIGLILLLLAPHLESLDEKTNGSTTTTVPYIVSETCNETKTFRIVLSSTGDIDMEADPSCNKGK